MFEVGIVFRGFVLTKYNFKEIPSSKISGTDSDLRGAFISAINIFAEKTFINSALEYLELENFLFIFKISEIKASDGIQKEPIIFYGLTEKKRNPDRYVRKFFEKLEPVVQFFIQKFTDCDFTEIDKFEAFKEDIREFFD